MSKPWPDELRQMVDALMHGGACPSVYGCSDGGWRIHTGRAWADYDEQGRWWFDGSFRNAAVVLAELLQRSDTIAPAQTRDPRHALQERILAAVPGALVAIWSDGIEVSVGSKSVRWKCEKNGWSLGDDLFASDDRVIEHARAMAADAAPKPAAPSSLLERLREAVPGLTWRVVGGVIKGEDLVWLGDRLQCWTSNSCEPHAVEISRPSDDECVRIVAECVRIVAEWYAKTHPAPAAEQVTLPNRGSLGGVAIGNATLSPAAPQPSPRALDTDAAMQAASNQMLRARQQRDDELMSAHIAGADFGRGRDSTAVTINMSASVLDAEAPTAALTRAIDEQSKAQRSHEWQRSVLTRMLEDAKERGFKPPQPAGATTMTQTKTEALTQTIKLDASEAAWRTAGSQFVKLAREPLVGLLTRHLAPNDEAFRARLAAFLETELGTALLASMLSATLSALPQTTGEVPQKLARELRVRAMADAGDVMADVLLGPLRQVMALYLQDPAGTPAAAPALDAPRHEATEFAATTQREGVR